MQRQPSACVTSVGDGGSEGRKRGTGGGEEEEDGEEVEEAMGREQREMRQSAGVQGGWFSV